MWGHLGTWGIGFKNFGKGPLGNATHKFKASVASISEAKDF